MAFLLEAFLLIDKPEKLSEEFAKIAETFATEHKTTLQTFTEELPSTMNEDALVFIEKGFMSTLRQEQLEQLVTATKEKWLNIVSNGDLSGYGITVTQESDLKGNKLYPESSKHCFLLFVVIERCKVDTLYWHFPRPTEVYKEILLEGTGRPTPDGTTNTILAELSPNFIPLAEPKLTRKSPSKATTTLTLPRYEYDVHIDRQGWIKTSKVATTCEVNITLEATKESKKVHFEVNYTVGSGPKDELRIGMANTNSEAKGFFTDSAEVYFFPGNDPSSPQYKTGWGLTENSPQARNFEVTKSDGTEYHFSVEAGYAGGPRASADAESLRSHIRTVKIPEFGVLSSETGWSFFYRDVSDDSGQITLRV